MTRSIIAIFLRSYFDTCLNLGKKREKRSMMKIQLALIGSLFLFAVVSNADTTIYDRLGVMFLDPNQSELPDLTTIPGRYQGLCYLSSSPATAANATLSITHEFIPADDPGPLFPPIPGHYINSIQEPCRDSRGLRIDSYGQSLQSGLCVRHGSYFIGIVAIRKIKGSGYLLAVYRDIADAIPQTRCYYFEKVH